ncbi:MAG: hypothetical protein ACI4LE_03930 [Faecalibacterium sp.]
MKDNTKMRFPADCALLTEAEQKETVGGSAVETVVKAVVAVGVAGALLCVAGAAVQGILSFFGGGSVIEDAVNAGKNFIDDALYSGQKFLDGLMGK